jgi:SRSO17 transposase
LNTEVVCVGQAATKQNLLEPRRWGLPAAAVDQLGDRLHAFYARFDPRFKTKTRHVGACAQIYLRGLLTMETKRNFANMARRLMDPEDDGQRIQYFISESPWSGPAVMRQIQQEIAATPELRTGGVVLLDESADEKAGVHSAGAGRQHNGRLGKVEMSQVGTFLAFYKGVVWTWVDGELFLPQHWFSEEMAVERQRLGVPADRQFATKIELGWQMIQRVQANGLPFEAVACDDLYGRSGRLRRQLDQAGIVYMAEVPASTQVYLQRPDFGVPPAKPGTPGRKRTRRKVLDATQPIKVRKSPNAPPRSSNATRFGRQSAAPWRTRLPSVGCGRSATASWPKNGW